MTECASEEMRDALPDLLHGRLDASRTAIVEAHVATCAQCLAELDLMRRVIASAPVAPPMDASRIAAALPTPARPGLLLHRGGGRSDVAHPRPLRGMWSRTSLRIAAAIAIVSAGGLALLVGREVLNPEVQVGGPETQVAASRAAATATVLRDTIMATTAAPEPPSRRVAAAASAATGLSLVGEVQEISDEHLATLLQEMDRMDGIPSDEPEAVGPAVGDVANSGTGQ